MTSINFISDGLTRPWIRTHDLLHMRPVLYQFGHRSWVIVILIWFKMIFDFWPTCQNSIGSSTNRFSEIGPMFPSMQQHRFNIVCLFVVVLCYSNSISVTSWQWYDVLLKYYEMRRRKPELTLLPTQGIFNLAHHIGMVWEELASEKTKLYTAGKWSAAQLNVMAATGFRPLSSGHQQSAFPHWAISPIIVKCSETFSWQ